MTPKITSSSSILHQKIKAYLSEELTLYKAQMSDNEVYNLIVEIHEQHIELEMQNTELLLANERSEIAAQEYANLYDFAPFGYFTLSPERYIININLSGAQMLGQYREEVLNTQFDAYLSPASKSIFKFFIEKVFSSTINLNCELILLNQAVFFLEGKVNVNGSECFLVAVDISERRNAEEKLIESEEKYHQITDNIKDVVWTADMELNLTYVSPSVEKMMRETPENHSLRRFEEKFTEQSLKNLKYIYAQELINEKNPEASKDRSLVIEVEYCRTDGTTFWAEINSSYIRDENMKAKSS